MGNKKQDALYKELINGRRRVAHGYNLRVGDDMATGYSMFLCCNSFINILGVGKTRYTNLQATRLTPGVNTNKNSGNSHAAMTAGTKQSVIYFINQKGKEEGEVYGTGIIRSMAGYELREEEKGFIDLPSNTSRREMYKKYCFERGWAPKSDSKVRSPSSANTTSRSTTTSYGSRILEHRRFVPGGRSDKCGKSTALISRFGRHAMTPVVNELCSEMQFAIESQGRWCQRPRNNSTEVTRMITASQVDMLLLQDLKMISSIV
jgi:hypothetical protein